MSLTQPRSIAKRPALPRWCWFPPEEGTCQEMKRPFVALSYNHNYPRMTHHHRCCSSSSAATWPATYRRVRWKCLIDILNHNTAVEAAEKDEGLVVHLGRIYIVSSSGTFYCTNHTAQAQMMVMVDRVEVDSDCSKRSL